MPRAARTSATTAREQAQLAMQARIDARLGEARSRPAVARPPTPPPSPVVPVDLKRASTRELNGWIGDYAAGRDTGLDEGGFVDAKRILLARVRRGC